MSDTKTEYGWNPSLGISLYDKIWLDMQHAMVNKDNAVRDTMRLIKSEKTVLEFKNEATSDYLELLHRYLPKMVAPKEIEQWIRDNVYFSAFKSPMQAMVMMPIPLYRAPCPDFE